MIICIAKLLTLDGAEAWGIIWLEKLELINGWLLKSSKIKNILKKLMFLALELFYGKLEIENLLINVKLKINYFYVKKKIFFLKIDIGGY
jgi:hypothetical protein